jgi:hypothetical protein
MGTDLPPLGDGGMDLPYEANPEKVDITENMILAGGVVVAAATVPLDGHNYPALLFRFALPHGEFLPAVTLVCMPAQLEALLPLMREAVAGAVKAAAA